MHELRAEACEPGDPAQWCLLSMQEVLSSIPHPPGKNKKRGLEGQRDPSTTLGSIAVTLT